jgi:Tfp pilus assembly protein PilN
MRVINFLPDDYRQRISARRANLVCVLAACGTVLAIGGAVAYTYVAAAGTANLRSIVQRQYDEANRQVDQAKQLEEHKSGLLHKVELSTALLERVPVSRLLAVMTNYLPTDASLTSVSMRVEEVEAKAPAKPSEADAKAADAKKGAGEGAHKTLGNRNSTPTVAAKTKRVVFRVNGLAQTDVQVAEYLNRLGADPLFEDVDLQFTEAFPYQEGVTMRRFEATFSLNAQADKIIDLSISPKLLTAGPAAVDAGKGAS